MKVKLYFLSVLTAFSLFSAGSLFGETPSGDFAVIRAGYTPFTTVNYNPGMGSPGQPYGADFIMYDFNAHGPAISIEYNINSKPVLLSFGLEYSVLQSTSKFSDGTDIYKPKNHWFHFIAPGLMMKYLTESGVYAGIGFSGKYKISNNELKENIQFKSKIDYWINISAGYMMKLQENYYLDIQGRFGYNLTNNQFSDLKDTDSSERYILPVNTSCDAAIFVGVALMI